MARTSNVFARVEPEIKEQAEEILTSLASRCRTLSECFCVRSSFTEEFHLMKLPRREPLSFVP